MMIYWYNSIEIYLTLCIKADECEEQETRASQTASNTIITLMRRTEQTCAIRNMEYWI